MLDPSVALSATSGSPSRTCRRLASALRLAALTSIVCACSVNADETGPRGADGTGGNPQAAPDAGEPAPTSLAFAETQTLTLAPGATHTLEIVASPRGVYRVQFALLGTDAEGGPGGAALDRSEAWTDAKGTAEVTLTAPRTPAIFSVRASVGMAVSAELAVSVSDLGYGTLRVQPVYAGKRDVKTWFASVRDGQRCDELGSSPSDGTLFATAPKDGFPEIADVPVGPVLAVLVRAGHFVSGCATLQTIDPREITTVPVSVIDRPMNLAGTRLAVTLGLQQPSGDWDAAMYQAVESSLSALVAGGGDDATVLLDAMQAEAGGTSFGTTRFAEAWDDGIRQLWGAGASTRLRDVTREWMREGLRALVSSDAFSGVLAPDSDGAVLELMSVAGHAPKEVGFNTPLLTAWSADASDTLLFGTSLLWAPPKLLTTLAVEPALAEYPELEDVQSALAEVARCSELGEHLASLGTSAEEAYAGCDGACLQSLCEEASAALWERMRGVTTPTPATLAITASGAAKVGDTAEAVQLDGSWVGQLQSAGGVAMAGGKLRGEAAKPQ